MKVTKKNLILTLIIAFTLLFGAVLPVAAQELGEEVEITGTIVSIVLPTDTEPGSFDVETPEGIVTVYPEDQSIFSIIKEGDMVEIKGTENEDGSLAGSEIEIEEPELPEEPVYPNDGYYCTQSEDMHPMGARLAERFETDYATLQEWFCNGAGWGQVMLALQTSKMKEGVEPGLLLEARESGEGWGNIWKDLGLIGKKDKDDTSMDDGDMEEGEEIPEIMLDKNDKDKKDKPNIYNPSNENSNRNKDKNKKK